MIDDGVQVILSGSEVLEVENYRISVGMLTQPAAFQVQINKRVGETLFKHLPGTPFQLKIAGTTQFDGKIDGFSISGSGTGSTIYAYSGRDALADLHDTFVDAERTFTDVSIEDVTRFVLDKIYGPDNYTLAASNVANREVMSNASGKKGKITKKAKNLTPTTGGNGTPALNDEQKALLAKGLVKQDAFTPAAQRKTKKLQAKLGMRWYPDFLKPQLDRAGLFLWSTQGGTFILSELDTEQSPLYQIVNRRNDPNNFVKAFTFQNNTALRYASCEVHGRSGGGKEPRAAVMGSFIDQAMTDLLFLKVLIVQDDKCTTIEECEFLARRRIAESRRGGIKHSYTFASHVTKQLGTGNDVIWIPDTVVQVTDDELGLNQDLYYVESVEHVSSPETSTTVNLMNLKDVVFGDGQGE